MITNMFHFSWTLPGLFLIHNLSLVEQELPTLSEHLRCSSVFSWVRFTRSLVLCVCFVDRCLSFCTFSFGHCVVCSSSIYGFWLPLWYLQTLLGTRTSLNKWRNLTTYSFMDPNHFCLSDWHNLLLFTFVHCTNAPLSHYSTFVCPVLLVSLDCSYMFVPSVFSNVYSVACYNTIPSCDM